MATKPKEVEAAEAPPPLVKPYDERRLQVAAVSQGETMALTLPDAEEIEEGLQNCARFVSIGHKLHMGQWIEVTNDAGSVYKLMRVEFIHGGRGAALNALSLRCIAPPYRADKAAEAPVANGEWHVHWGGQFKKFMIISPTGQVRAEGINTQSEARNRCAEMERNAGVFRR